MLSFCGWFITGLYLVYTFIVFLWSVYTWFIEVLSFRGWLASQARRCGKLAHWWAAWWCALGHCGLRSSGAAQPGSCEPKPEKLRRREADLHAGSWERGACQLAQLGSSAAKMAQGLAQRRRGAERRAGSWERRTWELSWEDARWGEPGAEDL